MKRMRAIGGLLALMLYLTACAAPSPTAETPRPLSPTPTAPIGPIRPPAVAGSWYPADPTELAQMMDGMLEADADLAGALLQADPRITFDPDAHQGEHPIEIELPFLQRVCPQCRIVPVLMGADDEETVQALADALLAVLPGRSAVVIASSDLSHYPSREDAWAVDGATLAGDVLALHPTRPDARAAGGVAGTGPPDVGFLLRRLSGAFVTIREDGELRGCIGHLRADRPLYRVVQEMAVAAATEDPRFPPLTREELERVSGGTVPQGRPSRGLLARRCHPLHIHGGGVWGMKEHHLPVSSLNAKIEAQNGGPADSSRQKAVNEHITVMMGIMASNLCPKGCFQLYPLLGYLMIGLPFPKRLSSAG